MQNKPKAKPGRKPVTTPRKEVRAMIAVDAHSNAEAVASGLGVTMTVLVERLLGREDLRRLYLETTH